MSDYEDDFEVDEPPIHNSTNPNSLSNVLQMSTKPSWLDDTDEGQKPARAASDVFGISSVSSGRPVSSMNRTSIVSRPSTSRGSRPMSSHGGIREDIVFLPPVPTHMVDGVCVPCNLPVLSFNSLQLQNTTLGGGGFAVVQKGIYQHMPVAIKRIFDPVVTAEMRAEFTNETKILARLEKHPHIMPVCGIAPEKQTIVMPEAEMAQSSFIIGKKKALLRHFLECALAVKHCHDKGVIHCDIKSHNFLIFENKIALIDFGTAIDTNETTVKPRDAIWQRGSPQYIAPEVFLASGTGGEPLTQAQMRARDVYALGVVFAELITTTFAYEGLDQASVKAKILAHSRPVYPASHSLAPLQTRMLNTDSAARANMVQVVDELRTIQARQ